MNIRVCKDHITIIINVTIIRNNNCSSINFSTINCSSSINCSDVVLV